MKVTRPLEPEPRFRAPCGVFCPTCFLYMGNHDDPARLPHASVVLGVPEEDLRCEGCGSSRTAARCASCAVRRCAEERGVDSCADCPEFPCSLLRDAQEKSPQLREAEASLHVRREQGFSGWFLRTQEEFRCPHCGTLNSVYDLWCRSCGASPSCPFAARNGEEALAFWKNRPSDFPRP